MGDGAFPEKLCSMDLSSITNESIDFINSNFLTHPEWDTLAAGKVLVLAEVLGKWMVAIKVRCIPPVPNWLIFTPGLFLLCGFMEHLKIFLLLP